MEITLADAAATAALGRRLADRLLTSRSATPSLLLLQGDLGAGKTEEEEAAMPSAAARAVVLAVEWPERLSSPPAGAWLVQLHHASAGRRAQLTAPRG